MWIVIESTPEYTLRGRTVDASGISACMLVATDAGGGVVFAQFIPFFTAEQIQAGW